jgi:hypothetical protein
MYVGLSVQIHNLPNNVTHEHARRRTLNCLVREFNPIYDSSILVEINEFSVPDTTIGCQHCRGHRLMPMTARVPDDHYLRIEKTLKIDSSDGIELPMILCLDCGTIQGDWPLDDKA